MVWLGVRSWWRKCPSLIIILLTGFYTPSSCLHQYHLITNYMNWTDAQSYCREKYTDLATVDDMEDLNRLITSGSVYDWFWIGLKKGDSLKWHWSLADRCFYREGETEFRNWDTGMPQNGNRAFMSTAGLWNNTSCDDQHHFICYDGECLHTNDEACSKCWGCHWAETDSW